MRQIFSVIIAFILIAFMLLAFSQIYNAPVVHDGPAHPIMERILRVLPINTNPIPDKASCSDVKSKVLLATERLSSCTDVSQCRAVWNANIDSVRVINKANLLEFDGLVDAVAASCGRTVYSPSFPVGEDEYKTELYCENHLCGYRTTLVETGKQRLYRETLSILKETSDIESQ
jgi:hypothetical protein